ncbi:hypothetical protein [Hydrogenimonas sp.]
MVRRLLLSLLVPLLLAQASLAYTTIDEEPSVFVDPSPTEPAEGETEEIKEAEAIPKAPEERLIYLTIEEVPKKIYVGQVFPVTIKVTSLRKGVPYTIELQDGRNVKVVKEAPPVTPRAINHLTYFFQATGTKVRLPSFNVRYEDFDKVYRTESIDLPAIALNPPADFSGLLAKKVELLNYQASTYDETSNILALQLTISYGNVENFRLPGAVKEGIDSLKGDLNATELLFFGVYPNDTEEVVFSCFNVDKNRYERFRIPVIVKRSSVSTQTNLDPQASEFTKFKIAATGTLIVVWLILWYRRRGWVYPILIGLATAYLLTYLIPLKNVCLKEGATVYLLPTPQSTPFMTLETTAAAKEMDRAGRYVKVQFSNNRIGWVKDEDLCEN